MADHGEVSDSLCTEAIISGIPVNVSQEYLTNFLECKVPGCLVDRVKFKKEGVALVFFAESIGLQVLQCSCEKVRLEGRKLTVSPVDKRGAVLIRNPCHTTTTGSFKFYLSNKKRSGGTTVLNIHRDENDLFVIAYYALREDAEQVAVRKHTLENQELQLEYFDPNFGELPKNAPEPNEDHSFMCPVTPASLASVQSDTSLSASAGKYNDDTIAPDTGAVGNRSEEVTEDLQDAIPHEKKVDKCNKTVEGLFVVYQNVLEIFCSSIPKQQLDVKMEIENDCLKIEGEQRDVEKAETLVHCLCKEQTSSQYVCGPAADFEGWDDVFEEIQTAVERGECRLVIQEGAFSEEKFCIQLVHADQSLSFDDFLRRHVSSKTFRVKSKEVEELLATTTWDDFLEREIYEKYANQVLVIHKGSDHQIEVIGNNVYVDDAMKAVEMFLMNVPDDKYFDLFPTEKDFVQKFWLNNKTCHQTGTGLDFAEVSLHGCRLDIRGIRAKVTHEVNKFKALRRRLKCKRVIVTHPQLGNMQNEQLWSDILGVVSSENQCIITKLPDPQIKDADEDQDVWGQWMATAIHSFGIPNQQLELHLMEGRPEDLKVDAAVVCCEYSSSQVPPVQAQGARPKNEHRNQGQQREGIRVIPSGGLPCKAVIEVSLHHYFPSHAQESWNVGMKDLMAELFQMCNCYKFRSLAVPVFGGDVGDDSKPYDVVTRIMAKCIAEQYPDGWSRQRKDSSLRHLCLCSPRAPCLRALTFTLPLELHSSMKPPTPDSLALLATDMPKLDGRGLDASTIQIHRGDISRAQVDALVVPCDIDIDLDLQKSPITKSLLRGGSYVQTSLQEGDAGYFCGYWNQQTIESRNEELAENRILMGRGGSLNAQFIFYVYLPPWGPGARKVLEKCVVDSLGKAGAKRCRSVGVAPLGVGKLDYPPACAARIALTTVSHFLETQTTSLTSVQFVVNDQATFEAYQKQHQEWTQHVLSGIGSGLPALEYPWQTVPGASYRDTLVEGGAGKGKQHHRGQANHSGSSGAASSPDSIMINGIKLRVKVGDIIHEKCSAIVNSTNEEFDFKGGVSQAILKQCSGILTTTCQQKKKKKQMKKSGIVITEAAGLANCQHILHLDLKKFCDQPKEFLLKCMTTLLNKYSPCRVVAFPALGTGGYKVDDPGLVVRSLKEALQALKKKKDLEEVRVISTARFHQSLVAALSPPGGRQPAAPHSPRASCKKSQSRSDTAGAACSPAVQPSRSRILATKVAGSRGADRNAMSLFIFSDSEENRETASAKLAEELEGILGPVQ